MTHSIKLLVLFVLAIGCISGKDQVEESIERKQLFDHNWKFVLGDLPSASSHDFNDESWCNLDLSRLEY